MKKSAVNSNQWAERPILFQTEMVKAILEGRKTQTRRTRGLDLPKDLVFDKIKFYYRSWPKKPLCFMKRIFAEGQEYFEILAQFNCPYGKPGDLLWVRETWSHTRQLNINPEDESYGFVYKSDGSIWETYEGWRWKPSIHMPKSASRIWLMIEDIRVERVQEISESDAEAEGVKPELLMDPNKIAQSFKLGFYYLWAKINGEESLDQNPWVWVIQFRVLSKTGKPSEELIEKNLCDLRASAVNQSEIQNFLSEIE